MIAFGLFAVAMLAVLTVWESHRYPVVEITPMPADGSAPPLPEPIQVH